MKASLTKQLKDGLITNNPIFVQFLGMCSSLAITTSVSNAVGMGLSVTAVLICSNILISLLRKFIVPQIRIAAFIVIISGFVTAVELLIKAFLPDLNKSLGLFIPLIVVNCIILARAESFASKNGVVASAIDGLSMGLGYTAAIIVVSFVRELLGTGHVLAGVIGENGITILGSWYTPANIFILPPGAFLTLAFLVALFQKLRRVSDEKKEKAALKEAAETIIPDEEIFPDAEKSEKTEKKAQKEKEKAEKLAAKEAEKAEKAAKAAAEAERKAAEKAAKEAAEKAAEKAAAEKAEAERIAAEKAAAEKAEAERIAAEKAAAEKAEAERIAAEKAAAEKAEAERIAAEKAAAEKAEAERIAAEKAAAEKAEAERKAAEKAAAEKAEAERKAAEKAAKEAERKAAEEAKLAAEHEAKRIADAQRAAEAEAEADLMKAKLAELEAEAEREADEKKNEAAPAPKKIDLVEEEESTPFADLYKYDAHNDPVLAKMFEDDED